MTIIPAVMSMLGARAWWLPAWLDRLIPNVDLESAGLARREPTKLGPLVPETQPGG
jgi:RND superfamily putative drug exporter